MRDIVLSLFIFSLIPWILMRPYIGLLVWSWIGYMNPHRLCYGFAYNFPWVELVAILTLLSLLFSRENKKFPISPFSLLLLTFLLWTGVTSLFAAAPIAAWDKWQEFGKIMVMVLITLMLVNTRIRIRWLVWVIVISLGFYGLKGGLFTLLKGGNYHVYGPPASFIADNNALALALCMTIPLMRYLQLHSPYKFVKLGLGISMALTVVAILGTYSRGGLLGLALVSVVLFLKSRRRLAIVVVVIAVGFTTYHFMPAGWKDRMNTLQHAEQTDSGQTRIQSYEFATNVALHHPMLGGGFDVYESKSMWNAYGPEGAIPRAVHSIYFRVVSEQGFPGLLLYAALLFLMWKNCASVRKKTRKVEALKWAYDLASMLQVSLVAYLAAGTFLPMAYFDLVYQLMALSALLTGLVLEELKTEPELGVEGDRTAVTAEFARADNGVSG